MPIVNHTLPVPAFLENTARFVAGPVTIGVEYRVLDEAMILDYYGPDAVRNLSQQRHSRRVRADRRLGVARIAYPPR